MLNKVFIDKWLIDGVREDCNGRTFIQDYVYAVHGENKDQIANRYMSNHYDTGIIALEAELKAVRECELTDALFDSGKTYIVYDEFMYSDYEEVI